MFEMLADAAAAWRTVVHVSEWSGLSIGALVAGAGLVYLLPAARKAAILGAILVVACWICLIHGDRVGRADVEAQWADARKAAIAADKERDAMIGAQLEATYKPKLAELQKQADERKAKADSYERKIVALLAKGPEKAPAGNACLLGAAANRMRRPPG